MKKKILITTGIIILVLFGAGLFITNGLTDGASITLNGVDLANVPDGSYTGTYQFKRWTNTLTVHVKDHAITGIDVDKDVAAAFVTNCSGETFRRVMEAQDTTVDAVSGATVTSKAYLKSIEDALK